MKQHLIAGLVSLSLALAGAASPVRAGSDDTAKILTGLVALFALSQALQANADRSSFRQAAPSYGSRNPNRGYGASDWNSFGKHHAYGQRKKYREPERRSNILPARCYYRAYTKGRMQGLFSRDCMTREMGSTRYLPPQCQVGVRQHNSAASAFDANCLRSYGYRVEARR